MQSAATYRPPIGCSEVEAKPSFNIVIAYEDFETGKQAKRTYDYLVEKLGHDCHFTNVMWKFDVLNIPKMREMAAKDAAMADIVIVACHGTSQVPPEVKAWIELWLGEQGHPIALVALMDTPLGFTMEATTVRNYLAEIALRGGMEFFTQPEEHALKLSFSPRPALKRNVSPEASILPSLASAAQVGTAFPRWGINE